MDFNFSFLLVNIIESIITMEKKLLRISMPTADMYQSIESLSVQLGTTINILFLFFTQLVVLGSLSLLPVLSR